MDDAEWRKWNNVHCYARQGVNGYLGELIGNLEEYGEYLYWLTVMGEPSATEPWGWQLDGHHLVINYFVLGDQVVMTPAFMGSEPVSHAGTTVLDREERKGEALMAALTPEQRGRAVLPLPKSRGNALAQACEAHRNDPAHGHRCHST